MIRTAYVIASSRLIRDATDNRISAIDLLDDFVTQSFPIVFPRTSLLWVLERDEGDPDAATGTVSISLDAAVLQQFPTQLNFEDKNRTRNIMVIAGMVVQAPGRLTFTFKRDDVAEPDATYSIRIDSAGPVAEGQPGTGVHGVVV